MQVREIKCLNVGDIELPREVSRLYDLAYNLWWSWNPEARKLFAAIDSAAWARYRNPVQMLINVEPERWEGLLESEPFMDSYSAVLREFERYCSCADGSWYETQRRDGEDLFAYFSMEYGVHHSLAIYSGGLGVLSGDHCKSASDLGLPFVGVGLLYRHGYFHQAIDADGLQQHIYPEYDFQRLPLRPVAGPTGTEVRVKVPLTDREVEAKVWMAQIGRIPLLLLDTDIPQNDPADRPITDVLYTPGREMRLIQELLLGIGGVKAIRAVGLTPTVWHLNEGHCAFLQLERLREAVSGGASFEGGLDAIRRDSVFTTHTPVPAGNEQFDAHLALSYLEPWSRTLGVSARRLLALGSAAVDPSGQNLNLTAFSLRTTSQANGVSRLNGEIVDAMWHHIFPEVPDDERVITGITNGIHTASWVGMEIRRLFERYLGWDWQRKLLTPEAWEAIFTIPDDELWGAHQRQKARLGRFLRARLMRQRARHGAAPDELRAVGGLFDPEALTLGFARRFATYKRANLVFRDLERFKDLVASADRPLQLIFAGKAHPADRPGQELIQQIFHLSLTERLRGRVFFLEDYDMRIGAMLVQGVDVWLNTPRRPLEASGTSGQKAAANGALNFSILDGWWP
ncbi:MAG: alpha-glucan family phosphorylase, partial [Acidobacteria bacterium]|nr:alpha-glucan family phosphorylase [Acidobacteriota bacterium]